MEVTKIKITFNFASQTDLSPLSSLFEVPVVHGFSSFLYFGVKWRPTDLGKGEVGVPLEYTGKYCRDGKQTEHRE